MQDDTFLQVMVGSVAIVVFALIFVQVFLVPVGLVVLLSMVDKYMNRPPRC